MKAGQKARTSPVIEARGEDGRGFEGPGLDHGVFVPFRIMFGEDFTGIPIVQVSIDSSLDPATDWAMGKAVAKLRCGINRRHPVTKELTHAMTGKRVY